jgi:hypothetical protein
MADVNVIARLRLLQAATATVLKAALAAGENRLALQAIGLYQGQLELECRLAEQEEEAPSVNIHMTPEWVKLRTKITAALASHPEARAALAGVLTDDRK